MCRPQRAKRDAFSNESMGGLVAGFGWAELAADFPCFIDAAWRVVDSLRLLCGFGWPVPGLAERLRDVDILAVCGSRFEGHVFDHADVAAGIIRHRRNGLIRSLG